MSIADLDLESLSIDQMLDLKDALEAKLMEIAKTESAPMAERLKRLQTYLQDEKPSMRRAKKPAKPQAPRRTPTKASSGGAPKTTGKPAKKGKLPPKYRDPDSGKTWSGRGMVPVWLRELEAAGRERSEFAV